MKDAIRDELLARYEALGRKLEEVSHQADTLAAEDFSKEGRFRHAAFGLVGAFADHLESVEGEPIEALLGEGGGNLASEMDCFWRNHRRQCEVLSAFSARINQIHEPGRLEELIEALLTLDVLLKMEHLQVLRCAISASQRVSGVPQPTA